ncbi:RNA-binding protein YlmH [Oikeobacillus pervagus]|uniref:RNA-binding protein YlmH n=1 Tax=Oikeobacillus pervagus TaxID=1325931 RepID=A0AAJ1SYB0_9BACI|nr:RNA-binding protein [Oikeobacillus pervagus]MDQ0215050.1 RNA-binding protein YlmH [Oikeobacillus pervagus]
MTIYQHFRPEEHEFIDKVLGWKQIVESQYAPKLTDFLDPREQKIVQSIVGNHGEISVSFFGGTEQAERKRALIFPEYFSPEEGDFNLILFEVTYPKKFIVLEHRNVLGSLMGLGLRREKYGDILADGDCFQFFVTNEIKDYVKMNLDQIGRASITLEEKPLHEAVQTKEIWRERMITTSSLRLDTILSSFTHQSRQKVQNQIKSGLVKVNWTTVEETSFECDEGDVISVRGIGRSRIMSVNGKTKKEKWRITIGTMN